MAEDDFYERLKKTWPAKAIQGILGSITAPGDAWAGRLDPLSEEGITRTNELAGVAMTGGLPVKQTGGILASGLTLPKLKGGYHGTAVADDFGKFRKSDRDLGTHYTTDPDVARRYSMEAASPPNYDTGLTLQFNSAGLYPGASARTMPVVGDVRKSLRYPGDPINWKNSNEILSTLEHGMQEYPRTPIGLLSYFEKLEAQPGGLQKNLIPALQEKGYDSILYPHSTKGPQRFNSIMAFDPEQVIPRFSERGQALIQERGVTEPLKSMKWGRPMDIEHWKMRHGLLDAQSTQNLNIAQKLEDKKLWEDILSKEGPYSKYKDEIMKKYK